MKRKLKGFTLIELIVVLATFSVIMFGAMSLMAPVSKIMVMSSVHENGNAAVSNMSRYIQNELSPVEYLTVYDDVGAVLNSGHFDDTTIQSRINTFVRGHYAGIIRGNSAPDSPNYASGIVHVMLIDNTDNGRVSSLQYECDFTDSGATNITQISEEVYAVNKAYYDDDYNFEIKFGNYSNDAEFSAAVDNYDTMTSNLNSKNTVLTIRAETTRNNTAYAFFEHAAMPLVNIYNRSGAAVDGIYFTTGTVQAQNPDGTPKYQADGITPVLVDGIVDVTDSRATVASFHEAQSIIPIIVGTGDGYCFIYSYSNEIDTAP